MLAAVDVDQDHRGQDSHGTGTCSRFAVVSTAPISPTSAPTPTSPPTRRRTTWSWSASASPAAARRSRRPGPARGCCCSSGPPCTAARRRMSGGHFYLGGGTAVQQATGHEDSAEEMYKYLVAVSKEPEPDKIRAYCDGLGRALRLARGAGLRVRALLLPGEGGDPARHPGADVHRQREGLALPATRPCPAPRGHKVPVPGDTEGTKMVMDLLRDAGRGGRRRGPLRDRRDQPRGLRRSGARGRRRRGGRSTRPAWSRAPAVVIAAGGFVMNPDMVAAYTPALGVEAVHARLDVRRRARHPARRVGRRRAQAHGRAVHHRADLPAVGAGHRDPGRTSDGERFVAEDSYHSRTSQFVMEQPDADGVPHRRQRARGVPASSRWCR